MINDTIISGLLNLFALLGAAKEIDIKKSERIIYDYLGYHFGIRNKQVHIDLYRELRELYSLDKTISKTDIVKEICTNLKGNIEAEDMKMILLRLMEFIKLESDTFNPGDAKLQSIAEHFNIDKSLYDDFCNFVQDKESERVRHQTIPGYNGFFKTLWIESLNKLLFSYVGSDHVTLNDVQVLPGIFQTMHQSSVLKNHKGAPIYYSTIRLPYIDKHQQKVEYCGRDIEFRFPNHDRSTKHEKPLSDNGIHDFSFNLNAGELVAIMGGSGTGKTTLLMLLNGILKPQSGTLTINGRPINAPEVKKLIGYVPQDDLLIEELTVYQNLYYTARLCFDGISPEELHKRVMTLLQELGLAGIKDLKVGSAINKSISGGQRKRLNIALELIREPSVLFLDEPTSGLSSMDTEHLVGILKTQTYQGRLIVMNIHQPSSDVYKLFDRLWILDTGGYPVFDGNPIDAITYFKEASNFTDPDTSTCPVCGNLNPEQVLNIINAMSLDSSGMITSQRKTSPQQWHEMYLANRPQLSEAKDIDIPASEQRKPGPLRQLSIYLQRTVKSKLTNLQYILITLLEAPVLAAVCALLTRYSKPDGYTLMDNKNLVSYLFMSVIVAIFLGMSGSAEEIIKDRALLKREKFLNLSYGSYIWSKISYAAIVTLIQTLLFTLVGNSIMGLSLPFSAVGITLFMTYWLVLFMVAQLSSLIGLLLSQCLKSIVAIYISIPILLIPQILLCGVVVDFNDLNTSSKTGNVPMIGNIIPSRWAFEALAVEQYSSNAFEKQFFDVDKENYQTLYWREAYLGELETQLETAKEEKRKGEKVKAEHMQILKASLPGLTTYTGMEEYQGDYSYPSLSKYLADARSIITDRTNKALQHKEAVLREAINAYGKENILQTKRDNHNLRLHDFVSGIDNAEKYTIVDGQIAPRAGAIFLEPVTNCGNAPFYSSEKIIGGIHIPTLWFNLAVLLFMSIIMTVMLLTDYPGRKLRH